MLQRNDTLRGLLLAFCLFLGAATADTHAEPIHKLHWTTLGDEKSPCIRIVFKGGQSRLFQLDTGSFTSFIDRKVAAELHLTTRQRLPAGTTTEDNSGDPKEFVAAPVSLGPGALSVPDMHFYLADLSVIRSYYPAVAGMIGMDLLAKYSLRMDYSRKQVDLIPGSVKGTVNEPTADDKLPLIPVRGGFAFVGSLDNVKIDFILDTGAAITTINEPEALKRLKPRAILNALDTAVFGSEFTTLAMVGHKIRLQELTLGKVNIKNPIVMQGGVDSEVSCLGNDFLQRFRMVIDFQAQALYLTPDPAFKAQLQVWDVLVDKPTLASPSRAYGTTTQTGAMPGFLSAVPFKTPPAAPMPLVSLSLEDGKPHLFLVDPGSSNCLLDAAFVKSEKLKTQKLKTEADTEVNGVLTTQVILQAPVPLRIEKVPFGVEDLGPLRRQTGTEVVGVLGANLLRVCLERVDFSKQQIEFFVREDAPPPSKQAHRITLQADGGLFYLKTALDGASARFRMSFLQQDTSLQETSLLSTLQPVAQVKNLTSAHEGDRTLRFQSLIVEDVTWTSPVLYHSPNPAEAENMLGMDFFSRFYTTLDLSANRLYLEPDPHYHEDLTKWLGIGLNVMPDPYSAGILKVAAIASPSPASEAGLKIGDDILRINGMPVATTPLATLYDALKHVEGAVVKLKIQRKGEDKTREFTLKMAKLL